MKPAQPRALVLGDLVLDVVLAPDSSLRRGTDVAGRVILRQGGSAASTARWLARLGIATTFVTAVGDDGAGEALAGYLASRGVTVHAIGIPGSLTGRLGVLLEEDGERSFVADRGSICRLSPGRLRVAWFAGLDLIHLPVYSLVGDRLAVASSRAVELARRSGARVSVDLASAGFLASEGPERIVARVAALRPDVVFATRAEAGAAGGDPIAALLALAPLAVVKEGAQGASVHVRGRPEPIVVPARAATTRDTTGAGDAFDGGFLARWLGTPVGSAHAPAALRRAVLAGHRAAARELFEPRDEFGITGLALRGVRRSVGEPADLPGGVEVR